MRRTLTILSIGAIIALAASPAAAGIYEKSFELGLQGGIQSGDSDQSVSSDSSYGLHIGFAITPKIQIELGLSSFDTSRDITGFAGPASNPTEQVEFSDEAPTEFTYYSIGLTANFLTETDSRTLPYISVGLGSATETRDASQFCIDLKPDADPNSLNAIGCDDIGPDGRPVDPGAGITNPEQEVSWQRAVERKDTGTLLTIGAGARTFFGEWFAVRYEVRYYHHDTFENNQDAFEATLGATFVLGGRR